MAFELARQGLNVVLVGRDPGKLRDVSDTITKTHAGVQTKTVLFDLAFVSTAQGDRKKRDTDDDRICCNKTTRLGISVLRMVC